jgi:hypothetical protein
MPVQPRTTLGFKDYTGDFICKGYNVYKVRQGRTIACTNMLAFTPVTIRARSPLVFSPLAQPQSSSYHVLLIRPTQNAFPQMSTKSSYHHLTSPVLLRSRFGCSHSPHQNPSSSLDTHVAPVQYSSDHFLLFRP